MPTLNIPPRIRFTLYILAALGSVVVVYAMDKNWAGEAEFKCWTGVAGLLSLLAASKTSTNDNLQVIPSSEGFARSLDEQTAGPFGPDEAGHATMETVVLVLFALILLFVLLSVAGLR